MPAGNLAGYRKQGGSISYFVEVDMNDDQKREFLAKFDEDSFPDEVTKFVEGEALTSEERVKCDKFVEALFEAAPKGPAK